jgi:deoxyadenosine/deoxycytidine kinase
MEKRRLIYISGNNGVGKTTLTGLIGRAGIGYALPSVAAQNSYCDEIHRNPKNVAFEAQIAFLAEKADRILLSLRRQRGLIIVDRSPYEDAEIFARYWYEAGAMDRRAFRTYVAVSRLVLGCLPQPHTFIYLHASVATLKARISGRLRPHERRYTEDFLSKLQILYRKWSTRRRPGNIISVDMDRVDFLSTDGKAELNSLTRKLQQVQRT